LKGSHWNEAARLAFLNKKSELIDTLIKPGVEEGKFSQLQTIVVIDFSVLSFIISFSFFFQWD